MEAITIRALRRDINSSDIKAREFRIRHYKTVISHLVPAEQRDAELAELARLRALVDAFRAEQGDHEGAAA